MSTLQRLVPDSSVGFGKASLSDATAQGTAVNYGGVAVGTGGETVPCWVLDDFGLTNVSLLKLDAVRGLCVSLGCHWGGTAQRSRAHDPTARKGFIEARGPCVDGARCPVQQRR